MRGYLKRLLTTAPSSVNDIAKLAYDFVPPSMKYGKDYRTYLSLFKHSDLWDKRRLLDYQESQLRKLITHCYTSVPYYSDIFNQQGLKPDDINTIEDLRKLPFLTKEIVRRHKRRLRATNVSSFNMEPEITSGSTGVALDFDIDTATRAMERALSLRQLLWLGYEKGDVIAEIKEDSFADPNKLYSYFPASKQIRFSFFRADESKLATIVEVLRKYRPTFLKAYPSSLYVIARWMERNKKTIPSIRYVLTSSENLYPSIKEQAEKVFKAPVVDHYGQNEQVAYAFQCRVAQGYHVQGEQCIMELVPNDGDRTEIVSTSLTNLGMPFVRYKTGDIAIASDDVCPCGRKHPIISEISGRETELIITPEGNIVAPVAMDYAFYHLEEIREGQIIQEELNTLRVKIVPWEGFCDRTKDILRKQLNSYLDSPKMELIIDEVDEIPRTNRGKRPFVISKIKVEDYL